MIDHDMKIYDGVSRNVVHIHSLIVECMQRFQTGDHNIWCSLLLWSQVRGDDRRLRRCRSIHQTTKTCCIFFWFAHTRRRITDSRPDHFFCDQSYIQLYVVSGHVVSGQQTDAQRVQNYTGIL